MHFFSGLRLETCRTVLLIGASLALVNEGWSQRSWERAPIPDPNPPPMPNYEDRQERSAGPQFSRKHGYYREAFQLTLSSPDSEAEIRYTTDGSVPLPEEGETDQAGRRYQEPIAVDRTSWITAVSRVPGKKPSVPVTRTYLFLDDILKQSLESAIADGWPARPENGKRMDYGLNRSIVEEFDRQEWEEAFNQIDTLSMVAPQGHFTDPNYGIYTNPRGRGKDWERYVSLELIKNDGSEGFQVGSGMRIRGGFTRNRYFVKHGFRLFFRNRYGAGKLRYKLFGDEGADRYDKMDLRTAQNYSWAMSRSRERGKENTYVREVFCRDTQRDLGSAYTRSRYYHLFLNGQFWGIYQTEERPEAAYGATYLGGDRDDYDTVKCASSPGHHLVEATDGNLDSWKELWENARALAKDPRDEIYARLTGMTPDLTGPSGEPALVEVDNLINYMLVHFYSGNSDSPLSRFMDNRRANNWFAIRNRKGKDGFRFFVHDAEHTLGTPTSENDRTGPYRSGNQDRFEFSNPQWLHQDLMSHPSYRRRFGELAQRHLTGGGALTTEPCLARFEARANQIDKAMKAQSARWGDASNRTGDGNTIDDWRECIRWVIEEVIPEREYEVIRQLTEDRLYPPFSESSEQGS